MISITLGPPQPRTIPPRWAFERVEHERCAYLGLQPNPLNVDVMMRDPIGCGSYHAWAAMIARIEGAFR
jgi:hypothetical protein